MELLEKINSTLDKTIKYVFKLEDGLITELAYIDNNTDKDIICVSSQTACQMNCRFCFTSDYLNEIQTRNLQYIEISDCVDFIYNDLSLGQRMLLVSYMGCGEPILNWNDVVRSMLQIRRKYNPCRFAIATIIPKFSWHRFFDLTSEIKKHKLPVKMHLSLHFTDDETRSEWMPNALEIIPSLAALEFYKYITGNSVEIHYTLIDRFNDYKNEAECLGNLLKGRDIPVKLLKYNARPCLKYVPSENVKNFMLILSAYVEKIEYYEPPGKSVGASCGELLMDYYLKYNSILEK